MLGSIPGILISNVAFPKEIESKIIVHSESCDIILPYLIKSIKHLESAGADFIILPCNTLHALLPRLKSQTNLEITDLVTEVSKEAKKFKRIGIIGTQKTVNDKLYENRGFQVIYPNKEEQKEVSEIIIRTIRKTNTPKDKKDITEIMTNLRERGAERIIFACTDLSNLNIRNETILDSQKILVKSIIGSILN